MTLSIKDLPVTSWMSGSSMSFYAVCTQACHTSCQRDRSKGTSDRSITSEDVMDDKASALCLILMGHVYDAYPETVILLKGIIDAVEEIA